jgi:hypothetical protein
LDGSQFAQLSATKEAASTADLRVTEGSGGAPTPIAVWHTSGDWSSRVAVSDGTIMVSVARDEARHDVVVRDRAATWTCTEQRCTAPGGTTLDL